MPINCPQLKKDYKELIKLKQEFDLEYKKGIQTKKLILAYDLRQNLINKAEEIKLDLPKYRSVDLYNWVKSFKYFDKDLDPAENAKYRYWENEKQIKDFIRENFFIDIQNNNIVCKESFKKTWDDNIEIEYLPKKLYIKGDLEIEACGLEEFPEDMKVNDSIIIPFNYIKKLPNNLTVNGSLDLEANPIHNLPERLHVKESLNIWGTKINSLPEDLYIGGNIYINNNLEAEAKKLKEKGKIIEDIIIE